MGGISILLSVLAVVNVLVCPGNSIRKNKEILKWMPEYDTLSLFDKLRINIVSTVQHFTSIPNIIFVLFSFLMLILVNKEKIYKLLTAVTPFLLSVILTLFYGYTNIIKKHTLNYVYPKAVVKSGNSEYYLQCILLVCGVIWLITTIINLYFIFYKQIDKEKNHKEFVTIIIVFFSGIASRFALIFSPTMISSGTRIYFVLYMSLIIIIEKMLNRLRNKTIKYIINILIVLGIIINIIMIYMMQQKYNLK